MRRDPAAPISNGNALPPEPPGLLLATVRRQLAVGPDHPPPGQTHAVGQNVPDRPRRPRMPGSPGYLTVADNLAAPNIPDDRPDCFDKRSFLWQATR